MRFHSTLLTGAAALALIGGAYAQEDPENQEGDELVQDTIVIYGQNYANDQSISAKRQADGFLDAVSIDVIGQLPDNNLAESLGRVPGVSTQLDEGVGRYIAIRGFGRDFIFTTIDGNTAVAAGRAFESPGRSFNYESIGQDFIGAIEVFKSNSADLDGNSIGGAVNIKSRRAFDLPSGTNRETIIDVSFGKNTSDELPFSDNDLNQNYSITHSQLFGSSQEFGLVLSGSYQSEDSDILKEGVNFYGGGRGIALSGGAMGPLAHFDRLNNETDEKFSLNGKFEYQPSEDLYAFGQILYFDDEDDLNRGTPGLSIFSLDETTSAFSGFASLEMRPVVLATKGTTYQAGLDWQINPRNQIELGVVHAESESEQDELRPRFGFGLVDGTFTRNDRDFRFDLDAVGDALYEDPSQYSLNRIRDIDGMIDAEVTAIKGDWANNMDGNEGPFGFKTGFKYTDTSYRETQSEFRVQGSAPAGSLSQFITVYDYMSPTMTNRTPFVDIPQLLNSVGGRDNFAQYAIDNFGFAVSRDRVTELAIDESVLAAYGMVGYTTDRVRARAGVRFEETEYEDLNFMPVAGGSVTGENSYDHFLPSASIAYDVNDDLTLRAAFSQTIGRPGLQQLVQFESIPDTTTGVFSRSNPDLQPRESNNYDIGFEWLLNDGDAFLSLGYFRKDIKNEIFSQQIPYQFNNGMTTIPSFFTQLENGGDAEVQGLEFGYIATSFDFISPALSNWGLNANYTLLEGELDIIDSDGSILRSLDRLPSTPETIFNVALIYASEKLSGRLAYQKSGDRTLSIAGGGDSTVSDDLVRESPERLDLQVNYEFYDGWQVYFEGQNLTGEQTFDTGDRFWDEFTTFGTILTAGVRARF